MIKIFIVLMLGVLMNNETDIMDFNSSTTSGSWRTVNDGVMGGVSQSLFKINSDSTATFKGTVSPENNGGFASVRTVVDDLELKNFSGAIIRVKGDGNKYSLRFRTNPNFDGISYQAKFQTETDVWKEFKFAFADFSPVWRGRTLYDQPELTSQDIKQIGVLISDKQYGDFELEIDWIKFY